MSLKSAVVIDAGTGNLHSVVNALESLEFQIKIAKNPKDINLTEHLILPGVGAFGNFMDGLRQRELEEPIIEAIQHGILLLGICVGMQALFYSSDEMGNSKGLNLLPGRVVHFPADINLKVPHTGWNQLWQQNSNPSTLLSGIEPGSYAYFNHSYYCLPYKDQDIAARTDYGISFTSVIHSNSIYGVQFHPEKSQRVGFQILKNFMNL
jgi:imidazole glycerol-phosphate synthase subunit HisH